jgi:hypothetical protein
MIDNNQNIQAAMIALQFGAVYLILRLVNHGLGYLLRKHHVNRD